MTEDSHRPDRPDPDATVPSRDIDADATRAMAGSASASASEEPGAMIGNYKLVRPLGEGGFGTVYLAEQLEPVKRRVALKIIKLGMDTKQVIARFEAEKQALALMEHPGIAKVYDAGSTATGRPYFVMELVQGEPVTEFCDRRRLGTRERLDLFTEICAAVQHAHQKGVIHRDIKPSNVLVSEVEGRPLPKVIDFGIAKATEARLTEKSFFTQEAQFIGTPAYMSPEQTGAAGLDVDTRSDIYSLGVLLYEMLAGVTPFDREELLSAGFAEIQRIIRENDPPHPSARVSRLGAGLDETAENRGLRGAQLVKRLRGELDWIVMKCLEKDRARRYETANGLARDIERFLANEPVVASPPSRVYRLKKLVVRNRAVFVAGAAMVILLGAGVVGTSIGLVRARQAEREAVSEATKSAQVAGFLTDMLAGVGPSAARGRDTEMLEEILEETDARIGEELADQPQVEGEIRSHLGQTYYDLGRLEKARDQYEQARDLLILAHGEVDGDVARQYSNLAMVHEALQEFDESETQYLKALEVRRQLFDGDNEDLAMNLINLANLYVNVTRYEEAEPLLREGLDQMRRLKGDEDEDVAIGLNSMGNLMQHLHRYDEAAPFYEEALAIHKATLGEDHPYVITDMSNLGWLSLNMGDTEDAARRFAEAAALSRRVYTEPHPSLIHAINAQANAEQRLGHFPAAEALFRESLALAQEVYGPDHPGTADAMFDLGECLSAMGRAEESDEMSLRAIAIQEKAFGADNEATMRSRYNYAYAVYSRGDVEKAIPLLEKSLAQYTAVVGSEHKYTALVLSNLGRALCDAGRPDEALAPLTECRDIRIRLLGPEHLMVGVSDHDLGNAVFYLGRLDEASGMLEKALTIYTAQLDSTHRVMGTIRIQLARIDLAQGHPETALERLALSRPITLAARGEDHWEMIETESLEGVARALLGEIDAAESLAARVGSRLDGLDPLPRALCQLNLGRIHTLSGRYEDAGKMLRAARSEKFDAKGYRSFLNRQTAAALEELKTARESAATGR